MNDFAVIRLFKQLWGVWPNKDKELQSRKALRILCKQETIDPDRLLAAANIYAMELRSQHCHILANWLLQDVYKDIYEEFRDVFEYEKRLLERRNEALSVIRHWKDNRRDWWCSIASEEDHVPNVEFSLRNKLFKEKWGAAFKIIHSVFERKFPEGDWRSKITPSLTWFLKTDYDSSTILRIIEGEFGKEKKERKPFDISKIFGDRKTMNKEEAKDGVNKLLEALKSGKELSKPKNNMNEFLSKIKKKDALSRFGLKKTSSHD